MAYFQPLVSNWIEIEAATAAGLDNFKTLKVDNQNVYFSVILKFPVNKFQLSHGEYWGNNL